MSFWDDYEKSTQEESGGGGIVALTRVDVGYKVYVAGVDQADTFFGVANAGDKTERDATKNEATAFGQSNGAPRAPQWGIQIRAHKADALSRGQPVTWQADRFFNTDSWTVACKEVVVPSLRQNEIAPPWEGWARIGFKPDPFKTAQGEAGMTDTDQAGNPRYPQVAYVIETFSGQEAAYAGVTLGEGSADSPFLATETGLPDFVDPEEWDEESWAGVREDLLAQELSPAKLKDYLMENYAIEATIKDMIQLTK